ncbi:MAG: AAA family ATPase, partial [Sedimenticola sp.]|nr:AAA family ATPase [Sedimenticola sp.]
RISEVTIKIPSLKDREGDALVLAKAFLERFRKEYGRQITGFDNRSIQAIENYEWPGNVREIESRIKRAVIMADNAMITLDDLELDFTEEDSMPLNLKQVRGEAERKAILRALNHSDSNISDTAKILGVTRPTLYSLMEKYDIKP